jgi:hypothetical protein
MTQFRPRRRPAMAVLGTLALLGAIAVTAGPAHATSQLPTPGLPVLTQVTATSMTFTWTASPGPVLNYTVQISANPAPWSDLATSTATTYTAQNLSPQTVYMFRVIANPAAGSGYTASEPSLPLYDHTSPLVDTSPPTKPVSVVVNLVGPTYATVAATMSSDNDRIAGYTVQRQVNGAWTDWATNSLNSIFLPQLTARTAYTVAVLAFDPSGNRSPRSDPVTFTTRPINAGPACRVQRQIVGPTNYILNIFIDNTTVNVLANWNVTFIMPAPQTLNYAFNGILTRGGDLATLTPRPNINPLATATSAVFGVNVSRPVGSPAPTAVTLNGAVTGSVACTITQLGSD